MDIPFYYYHYYCCLIEQKKKEEQVKIEEIETGEGLDDEDEEDLTVLYKPFREVYVFLAHIHSKDIADLILQELQILVLK